MQALLLQRIMAAPGRNGAEPDGAKTVIVFSHANSFSAGTYRRLLDAWRAAGTEVVAVERFGHDSRHPIGPNWRGMTRQLLNLIDSVPVDRLWLVGHSMGGYLSLIAAGQRPERVRGIILLDSPIIHGWRSGLVSVVKAVGQMHRMPQASLAARRRDRWASSEEAHAHFAQKPAFAAWHAEVLRDYVETGTEPDPEDASGTARTLSFRRDVEASIYATVPHWLVPYLRRHPPGGPVAFVGGRRSDVIVRCGLEATRRLTHGRISWLGGSHLFPFEQPDETVQEVQAWMRRLEAEGRRK